MLDIRFKNRLRNISVLEERTVPGSSLPGHKVKFKLTNVFEKRGLVFRFYLRPPVLDLNFGTGFRCSVIGIGEEETFARRSETDFDCAPLVLFVTFLTLLYSTTSTKQNTSVDNTIKIHYTYIAP